VLTESGRGFRNPTERRKVTIDDPVSAQVGLERAAIRLRVTPRFRDGSYIRDLADFMRLKEC